MGVGISYELENQHGFSEYIARNAAQCLEDEERLIEMSFFGSIVEEVLLEHTIYSIKVSLDHNAYENIDMGLKLLAGIAYNLTFAKVLNGSGHNRPQENPLSIYYDTLLEEKPFILDVKALDAIQSFYRTWYKCPNMALISIGDMEDMSIILERINKIFNTYDAQDVNNLIKPSIALKVPSISIRHCYIEEISNVQLFFRLEEELPPHSIQREKSNFSIYALVRLLKKAMNSLLKMHEHIITLFVEENRLSSNLRVFNINYSCKVGYELDVYRHCLVEIERLKKFAISFSDMERLKMFISEYQQRSLQGHVESTSESEIASLLRDYLYGDGFYEGAILKSVVLKVLQGWTSKDIQAASETYFKYDFSYVHFNLAKDINISKEEIEGILQDTQSLTLEPIHYFFNAKIIDSSSMPLPGLVTKSIEKYNGKTLDLGNGARIRIIDTKNDIKTSLGVDLEIYAEGGIAEILCDAPEKFYSAYLVNILARSIGIVNLDLNDVSFDIGVALQDFNVTLYDKLIRFTCLPSKIETMLQIVHMLFSPNYFSAWSDEKCLKELEKLRLSKPVESSLDYFKDFVTKSNWNNHILLNSIHNIDVKALDFKFSRSFLDRCFKNPSEFLFTLSGKLNEHSSVTYLIQKYIGSISCDTDPRRAVKMEQSLRQLDTSIKFTKGISKFNLHYGNLKNALFSISFPIPSVYTRLETSLANALRAALENYIFESLGNQIDCFGIKVVINHPFGYLFKGELVFMGECAPSKVEKYTQLVISLLKHVFEPKQLTRLFQLTHKQIRMETNILLAHNEFVFGFANQKAYLHDAIDMNLLYHVLYSFISFHNYSITNLLPNSMKSNYNLISWLGLGALLGLTAVGLFLKKDNLRRG